MAISSAAAISTTLPSPPVGAISFARRFTDLAAERPDQPAVTCGDETLTWATFDAAANRLARDLATRGVETGAMVTIALPNSVDWFVAAAACWKLGAVPQPVSSRLPHFELEAIVGLADPPVVFGVDPGAFPDRVCLPVGYRPPADLDDSPLPDAVSPAWKAPTSGGSTGLPKLIVSGDPSMVDVEAGPPLRVGQDACLVMPGPLYHNGPIVWSCTALIWGNHTVVLPRFDAEGTLAAIERHRADVVYLVPTMMKRIWALPDDVRNAYDLSSLRIVWHLAEPCPAWLKEAWIDWLGPERIYELYAGTEAQTATVITGVEWLEHRGSVGRPVGGSVLICDDDGNPLPPGEQGEIWLRSDRDTPTYRYVGATARTREGGWESLGDMGWVDEDGYLYLGDRRQDMILTGGANVYPAEIEAALQAYPGVRSCAVIGLPDEDKGNRIHAIVEADPGAITEADVIAFLAERLVAYKLPRTFEFVDTPLRDDAGKLRRSALRAERLADGTPARS
jgi:bile acid-coenzyme A ligase